MGPTHGRVLAVLGGRGTRRPAARRHVGGPPLAAGHLILAVRCDPEGGGLGDRTANTSRGSPEGPRPDTTANGVGSRVSPRGGRQAGPAQGVGPGETLVDRVYASGERI